MPTLHLLHGPAPDDLDDYWMSVIFPRSYDDEQTLLVILCACRQYISLGRGCEWLGIGVDLVFLRGGFGRRYGAMLEALGRLRDYGQVDALMQATDVSDLLQLPLRDYTSSTTWCFVLLSQVSRARECLAASQGLPLDLLRRKHAGYPQRLRCAMPRGLVVVLGEASAKGARRLMEGRGRSARLALGRVPTRRLLERTRAGSVDGVLDRILGFCSDDLVIAVDTEAKLRELSPWPLGTKLVTTRADAEDVQRVVDSVEGVESAYIYCAAGTLSLLLLGDASV